MIIRRFAEAVRGQDWATVTLEFFIVVAGIFVGLQVDDWSQTRRDRTLEREYLARLSEDTQWNIYNFHELESVFESKAAFIRSLRETPATESLLAHPNDFLQSLEYSTYVALPAARAATFSELQNSGRISLLRNVELRGELSSFYANYALLQEILDEPKGDYVRLVFEAIPGNVYYDWQISDNPDYEAIGEALSQLQADVHFRAAANAEIAYAASLIDWLRTHRHRAENILVMISQSDRNP